MADSGPIGPGEDREGRETRALPRRWALLSMGELPRGRMHLVVEALRRLGAREVEEERPGIVARFPPPADPELLAARVEVALESVVDGPVSGLQWRWESRDAWARRWLEEVGTLRIAGRFVVRAVGDDEHVEDGASEAAPSASLEDAPVPIRLRPGVGFGTGGHPTTRLVLELLTERVREGDRIVDVGAGSGIVSIAAALLGAGEVRALERDPLAVATARGNVIENGVEDRVRIERVEVGERGPRGARRAHGIVANLSGRQLPELLPGLAGGVRRGGWLLVSGAGRDEGEGLVEEGEASGFVLESEEIEEGWWAGGFRKRTEVGGVRIRRAVAKWWARRLTIRR